MPISDHSEPNKNEYEYNFLMWGKQNKALSLFIKIKT